MVDHFSKVANFVHLLKLPSALMTTRLITLHRFWFFGMPVDIMMDVAPNSPPRCGRLFVTLYVYLVSLWAIIPNLMGRLRDEIKS